MSSPASNALGEHLLPEPYPSKSRPDAPAYFPWATGPRICPGKKFSQVEFVAVVASIFSEWRVEPASVDGRSREGAMEALRESVEKARFNVTPKLYMPERAGVRWVKRGA
jgi:cytochrome P450